MSNLFILPPAAVLICIFFSVEVYCQNDIDYQKLADNKAVVTRYFEEVVNKQKPELLREIYAEDYLFHNLENGNEGLGLEGIEAFLPYFFKAFPDIHFTIDQLIAEGDKVVAQVTVRGTHKDEFWGYSTSNNTIKISEVFFYTLRDGKIIENRRLTDMFSLDKQLKGEE
jgi:steroid delta-isomerase-like uncharacterized protein